MPTKISWCDETINPVVGCSKVSDGCKNCYAESMASRLAAMGFVQYKHVTNDGSGSYKKWNGKTGFVPSELEKPYKWKKPRSIFISSMGDLFHETVPFEWVNSIVVTIGRLPRHTFIVLTKRAGRMQEFFSSLYNDSPLSNLVLGVSVENQQEADKRIPLLLKIPAAKRFVSLEPMLGPVDLTRLVIKLSDAPERGKPDVSIDALTGWHGGANRPEVTRLDGVILGGESGSKGRRLDPQWVISVRDQCKYAGVPFMFKQWSYENRNEVDPATGFPWLGDCTHSELAW